MIPNSRETLIEYCKQQLGEPVVRVNVDDSQAETVIEDALQLYQEYHYDSCEHVQFKHEITEEDMENRYFILPEGIINVIQIYKNNGGLTCGDYLMDLNYYYHLNLNDVLRNSSTPAMTSYQIGKSYLSLVDNMTNPTPILDWTRHTNKLKIEVDWRKYFAGVKYIVLDCYALIDPDEAPKVYNDRWLKAYCVAKMKKMWGINLKKFNGVALPGNITLNGKELYDEANEEIEKLETELEERYTVPGRFFVG